MAELGTFEVKFDTYDLLEICRVTCFNTNCIYHAKGSCTCDKKSIVIDKNGCVNSRDKKSVQIGFLSVLSRKIIKLKKKICKIGSTGK